MAEPFFSIIVTAYNAEKWITECMRSLLGQDFTDFECLVGDDASTDDTFRTFKAEVADDARFRYAKRSINAGGGENYVDLIRHARGEVCVELGADDFLVGTDALSRIHREYETFPLCDVTSGSMVVTPRSGVCAWPPDLLWWRKWCHIKPLTFRTQVALRGFEKHWKALIDPVTRKVPRYGWDVATFWPTLDAARQYRNISNILYAYRVHGLNDSEGHREEQLVTEKRLSEHFDALYTARMYHGLPWWPKERYAKFAEELDKTHAERCSACGCDSRG